MSVPLSTIREELPLVLKVKHLQAILNCSRVAVYQLVHRRDFPALRMGKSIRVPRDQFFKWMEQQAGVQE